MKAKKILYYLLVCSIFPFIMRAQNGQVATGGDIGGVGGNISFSIGQVDYITLTGSGGIAIQGNQQPYEIKETTGFVTNTNNVQLDLKTFPNPTFDKLTLQISKNDYTAPHFSLLSIDGKLLQKEEIISDRTIITLFELAKGCYILNVINKDEIIKSFNIIKN